MNQAKVQEHRIFHKSPSQQFSTLDMCLSILHFYIICMERYLHPQNVIIYYLLDISHSMSKVHQKFFKACRSSVRNLKSCKYLPRNKLLLFPQFDAWYTNTLFGAKIIATYATILCMRVSQTLVWLHLI